MVSPGYASLLDALRGVRWPARRRAPVGGTGAHAARARSVAPELTEYRPYRQGDDPRALDWKLLARSERAFIRLAESRALLRTTAIVDASASMRYPPESDGKWRQARLIALGLLAVAHAQGDPVGLAVAAPAPRLQPPRSRRDVLGELARTLDGAAPGGAPDLAAAFALAAEGIDAAARVPIVSDFLGGAEDVLARARQRIVAGGEVVAVHVCAREELDPPARAFLAVDPECPEIRRPLGPASREGYVAAFAAFRDTTAHAWRAAGARYVLVTDDESPERAVRRIVAGDDG